MGRELTENSGSATEGLSSNYSAKQRDANAPESHEIQVYIGGPPSAKQFQISPWPPCQKLGI